MLTGGTSCRTQREHSCTSGDQPRCAQRARIVSRGQSLPALVVTAEETPLRVARRPRVLVLFRITGRANTSGLELGQMQTGGAALFYVSVGKGAATRGVLGSRARAR